MLLYIVRISRETTSSNITSLFSHRTKGLRPFVSVAHKENESKV